jgi:hypothetical protein
MSERTDSTTTQFEGTSSRGDFQEALQNAINAAQAGVPSTLINWTLDEVSGQKGGFVNANELKVTIRAKAPR